MRTTLSVDDDLQQRLLAKAEATQASYKAVVNDVLRRGLAVTEPSTTTFQPMVFDLGRPLVDLTKAVALADELDDQERIAKWSPVDRS